MMSNGTKIYIAARFKDEIIPTEVFKECASRTYEIGNDKTLLLTPLSFDSEQQSLNATCDLAASAIIKGSEYIRSLLQYSPNGMMVFCGDYKAIVVDVDTMKQLKVININIDVRDFTQTTIPLLSAHIIPGTGFKFMLEFYDSQWIYLRDVETG